MHQNINYYEVLKFTHLIVFDGKIDPTYFLYQRGEKKRLQEADSNTYINKLRIILHFQVLCPLLNIFSGAATDFHKHPHNNRLCNTFLVKLINFKLRKSFTMGFNYLYNSYTCLFIPTGFESYIGSNHTPFNAMPHFKHASILTGKGR